MKNTGYPAVSSEGAAGALTPFEITGCDLKLNPEKPSTWPRDRVPTAEEWARILDLRARIAERRAQYAADLIKSERGGW